MNGRRAVAAHRLPHGEAVGKLAAQADDERHAGVEDHELPLDGQDRALRLQAADAVGDERGFGTGSQALDGVGERMDDDPLDARAREVRPGALEELQHGASCLAFEERAALGAREQLDLGRVPCPTRSEAFWRVLQHVVEV